MFFLSRSCSLCQRATHQFALCDYCRDQLQAAQNPRPLGCRSQVHPLPVFAWANYDGRLRRAMTQLKYQRQAAIGTWFGQQMAAQWRALDYHHRYPKLWVVPIPLFHEKLKSRGYNQAALIAEAFATGLDYPYYPNLLIRHRSTQAQFELGGHDRSANLAAAFTLGKQPHPLFSRSAPIILVDDIYTTGATIRSAAQTLMDAKFQVWGSAVAARPTFKK